MRIGRGDSILLAMSPAPSERPGTHPGESDLSSRYALAIVIEVLVILALYWLGRHFG